LLVVLQLYRIRWAVAAFSKVTGGQAMWSVYLSGNDGVAMRTTVSRLKKSLQKSGLEEKDFITGLVNYYFGTPPLPGDRDGRGVDDLIFHKRELFNYENEYRILHQVTPVEAITLKGGKNIRVDVETLVERVYISPKAKPWLKELLSSITEQYCLELEFVDSELRRRPFDT
jgi:hypothetical protein